MDQNTENRKKILLFNTTFFGGGVEKVLIDIANNIDKSKFDVTIMVMSKTGAFTNRYLALESEHIHIRQCFDWMTPGRNMFQKAKNVILIRLAEKARFWFPGLYHRIAIRDRFDIEIAFMHNQVNPIIACSPDKKARKIAWVHTDLRQLTTWKQYFGSRKRQGRFYQKYDEVVCVSQYVKDCLLELFDVRPPVRVIYNPVDRDAILQNSQEEIPTPPKSVPRLCAVGRLSHEKNFAMLLNVHKRLIDAGAEHELWIVGEGPERENLERIIRENALGKVTLWGYRENPYPFIRGSDITVCCSKYEGFHIVSEESLILGKPVVSSCAVVGELFGDCQCGLITDPKEDALFEGLYRMLTDAELLQTCTEEAKKRGEAFDIQKSVRQIEALLEETISK